MHFVRMRPCTIMPLGATVTTVNRSREGNLGDLVPSATGPRSLFISLFLQTSTWRPARLTFTMQHLRMLFVMVLLAGCDAAWGKKKKEREGAAGVMDDLSEAEHMERCAGS